MAQRDRLALFLESQSTGSATSLQRACSALSIGGMLELAPKWFVELDTDAQALMYHFSKTIFEDENIDEAEAFEIVVLNLQLTREQSTEIVDFLADVPDSPHADGSSNLSTQRLVKILPGSAVALGPLYELQ